MSVTNETVLLCLGYFIVYAFILNGGENLTPLRRLTGAILTICLGGVAMITLGTGNANSDENLIGITIMLVSVVFGIIQIGKVLLKLIKVTDKDE